jgi:UDPglucose--hexose-1-phosphate uridylyltransferase
LRKRENGNLTVKGFGHSEVVIESPLHNRDFSDFSSGEIEAILDAYQARYKELSKLYPEIDLVFIFKNHGRLAGTSLIHPHSQIIATPIVPLSLRNSLLQARVFCDERGLCPFCHMVKEEKRVGKRIVYENRKFIAICPFASLSPYEIWILPKRHSARFKFNRDDKAELADMLETILRAYHNRFFGDFSYNYIVKSAPIEDYNVEYFHWYIDILPRVVNPAGFEMGSSINVNPIPPEEAAREIAFQVKKLKKHS